MGDVQLPLRLSNPYYVGVSTSNAGEGTSPVSHATLFAFAKPALKFFRLPNFTKEKKSHEAKDGSARKVVVSLHWPFLSVVKSKGSETGSPSSSSGYGVKSPPEKSSPASSISPSSVLSKKLFIEENGGRKIGRDSLESCLSCNDAPKLSSVEEGEKEIKWDASGSFARRDHQLLRSAPRDVLEEDDDDDFIELDITKSECSSIYGDPSTSMRGSNGSDVLKTEAGVSMENSAEIGEKEIQWDDGDPGKGCEVAPSFPESKGKKTMACKAGKSLLVLKLSERFSGSSPLGLFMGKLLRPMSFSWVSHSKTLWVNVKKSMVLLAAAKMSPKPKLSGGEVEVELWKKNIPMGRRCRALELEEYSSYENNGGRELKAAGEVKDVRNVHRNSGAEEAMARRFALELEDSSYENNGGRELKAAGEVKDVRNVHRNSGAEEAMARRLSLCELMDAGAKAPLFNWTSRN